MIIKSLENVNFMKSYTVSKSNLFSVKLYGYELEHGELVFILIYFQPSGHF